MLSHRRSYGQWHPSDPRCQRSDLTSMQVVAIFPSLFSCRRRGLRGKAQWRSQTETRYRPPVCRARTVGLFLWHVWLASSQGFAKQWEGDDWRGLRAKLWIWKMGLLDVMQET